MSENEGIKSKNRVKIAVIKSCEYWEKAKVSIFNKFRLVFPHPENEGIKTADPVSISFIDYEEILLEHVQLGSDPYNRPFLFIYTLCIPGNKEIDQSTASEINKWFLKSEMADFCLLVLVFQQSPPLFQSLVNINKSALIGGSSKEDCVIVLSCQPKWKNGDQNTEYLKSFFSDRITSEYLKWYEEVQCTIEKGIRNSPKNEKLLTWNYLMHCFGGYFDTALQGFLERYDYITNNQIEKLETYLKYCIDACSISKTPKLYDNTYDSCALFSLHGAMAIYLSQHDMKSLTDMFFKHIGFLRTISITNEDEIRINNWTEREIYSILALFSISEDMYSQARLLVCLLLLNVHKNGNEATNQFSEFDYLLQQRSESDERLHYSSIIVSSIYYTWATVTGHSCKDTISTFNGWKSFCLSSDIGLKKAIEKLDYTMIGSLSSLLLNDKSVYSNKNGIIDRLSTIKGIPSARNPFCLGFRFSKEMYSISVQIDYPCEFSFKVIIPEWLKSYPNGLNVKFINSEGEIVSFPNTTNEISSVSVLAYFSTHGKWRIIGLEAIFGDYTIEWSIPNKFSSLSISVLPRNDPKVDIKFPILFEKGQKLQMQVELDYSSTCSKVIQTRIISESHFLEILSQSGVALFNDESIDFEFDENFLLTFKFNGEQKIPSMKKVRFSLSFILYEKHGCSLISVKTLINKKEYVSKFDYILSFPIELKASIISESSQQIEFINKSDTIISIKHITIGNQIAKFGDIHPLSSYRVITQSILSDNTQIMANFVDKTGHSVCFDWSLSELQKNIEYELLDDIIYMGKCFHICFDLPPCSYRFCPSAFIVIGCISQNHFDGGKVKVGFLPLSFGKLELPVLFINNEKYYFKNPIISVLIDDDVSMFPIIHTS